MADSFSINVPINCPVCQTHFSMEIWLFVVAREQPDLVNRLIAGELDNISCPNSHQFRLPFGILLLLGEGDEAYLLFSPGGEKLEEPELELAGHMVLLLREKIGAKFRESWLEKDSLRFLPRSLLPVAIKDGWDAALQKLPENEDYIKKKEVSDRLAPLLNELAKLDKQTDQHRYIEICTQALEIVPRAQNPDLWAGLHFELGDCLSLDDSVGSVANHDLAINHYRLALEVYKIDIYPADWARLQFSLAITFEKGMSENHPDNIENCMKHCEEALRVYKKDSFPNEWAQIQFMLGGAYRHRLTGQRAEDIEAAISHTEMAMDVLSRQSYPLPWAYAQLNLAICYRTRIRGDPKENIEKALAHNELALEIFSREAYPDVWAQIHSNLINVYLVRLTGIPAENFEQAIRHFDLVLEVFTQENFPVDWAKAHVNLAEVFIGRVLGDRSQNIERAISCCESALKIFARETYPVEWASANFILANSYSYRVQGERAVNLNKATELYESALQVFTPGSFPERWGMIQNDLAYIYFTSRDDDQGENLDKAIARCYMTLKILSREAFPERWAHVQFNLSSAYYSRTRGGRIKNLNKAIAHSTQALKVYDKGSYPEKWAFTQLGLINAFFERIDSKRTESLKQVIAHGEQLWQYLQGFFGLISAVEKLGTKNSFFSLDGLLIAAYHELSELEPSLAPSFNIRALEIAEASKSRWLSEQIGRGNIIPPPSIPTNELAMEQALVAKISELDSGALVGDRWRLEDVQSQHHTLTYMEQRRQAMNDLGEIWKRFQDYGLEAQDFVSLRRGDPSSWKDLKKIVEDSDSRIACLSLFVGVEGVVAFFWYSGLEAPFTFFPSVSIVELSDVYFQNYIDEILEREKNKVMFPDRKPTHAWRKLGERLLLPLMPFLKNIDHLVISADQIFHHMPIHALELNPKGDSLIDYVSISYASAFGSLVRLLKRPLTVTENSLSIGYSNAPPQSLENIIFQGEAEAVASELSIRANLGLEANSTLLRNITQPLKAIHLSCHGGFDLYRPLESAILLADGPFTARQWMDLHLVADLVTISACELGQSWSLGGGENLGFPQVLIMSGAQSALLGLWRVNAWTTLVFMQDFYKRWHSGQPKALALRHAMLGLRDGKLLPSTVGLDVSDPYFWASFDLYGNWQ